VLRAGLTEASAQQGACAYQAILGFSPNEAPTTTHSLSLSLASALPGEGDAPTPVGNTSPCNACTYKPSIKKLDGTINSGYTDHPFPLKQMKLTLRNSSNVVLDTITNLPPTTQVGGTSITQTVSTNVTAGVTKATLEWVADDSAVVTQNIDVI